MVKTGNGITFSVTRNGKELDESLYTWDDWTSTFTTEECDLVIDFSGVDEVTFNVGRHCILKTGANCTFKTGFNCAFITGPYCTFNTGSRCTFDTGSYCTFNTGAGCIFKTGYDCTFETSMGCTFNTGSDCTFNTASTCTFKTGYECTFNTGSSCTFITEFSCTLITGSKCVVVRRDTFGTDRIIDVERTPENEEILLCPINIPGYVLNGYYYKDGEKQYKAMIADGILSEIINHKGNVYKVKNYGEDTITYLVKDGDIYSHGKTLEEARENLKYKISNRDTSMYKGYTLETEITLEQAIKMYRTITGACETGVKYFVKNNEIPSKMTVKELIKITQGQYGNRELVEFFGGK